MSNDKPTSLRGLLRSAGAAVRQYLSGTKSEAQQDRLGTQMPVLPAEERRKLFDSVTLILTPEERERLAVRKAELAAQKEAWLATQRQWTDEEIAAFHDAFKAEEPAKYAAYVTGERKYDAVNPDLSVEIYRFIDRVHPGLESTEQIDLFGKFRDYARQQLDLIWKK